jgi:hypothetical protein
MITFAILLLLSVFPAIAESLTDKSDLKPVELYQVLDRSQVRLRLRLDTLPIEDSRIGPCLLVRVRDSVIFNEKGGRFFFSLLSLHNGVEVFPVMGETWLSSNRNSVRLSLLFQNGFNKPDSLAAEIPTNAIDRVFLFSSVSQQKSINRKRNAFFWIFAGPFIGGTVGLIYGKLNAPEGDGSLPGMGAFIYMLGGIMGGFWFGINIAIQDG